MLAQHNYKSNQVISAANCIANGRKKKLDNIKKVITKMVENKSAGSAGRKKKVMGNSFAMKKPDFEVKVKDLPTTAWFYYGKGMQNQ